ncbi:MAG: hypothetical protein GF335_01330 [Candidatus Moranbacteria bacterium]|nr:hypothetical protein [Candidatus Moranbacteria bacterium]
MIIGGEKLIQLNNQKRIVKNLSKREIENPEGPGFDLRAGKIYKPKGKTFLGVKKRKSADIKKIADYKNNQNSIILKQGDYFLIKTIEQVRIPQKIFAQIYPRSTLFRSGIILLSGKISPGYKGNLTFGIFNAAPVEFKLKLKARIAFIVFQEVQGKSNLSRGQWQGGRVCAKKPEVQV